jgi:hypothetical protein
MKSFVPGIEDSDRAEAPFRTELASQLRECPRSEKSSDCSSREAKGRPLASTDGRGGS